MRLRFRKYEATGNDFVLVDNRDGKIKFTIDQIRRICDRRFGIGADGVIQIEKDPAADFRMLYFNSDGSQSLCGNGSRAAVLMASSLGMINGKATFSAYDGMHHAVLQDDGTIRIQMADVHSWKQAGDDLILNTGSPHVIRFVTGLKDYPVYDEGRAIRYHEAFRPGGTNVNFVELKDGNTIFVRTYERGVENETFSCGTGVTAAALAAGLKGYPSPVHIEVVGGKLEVEFRLDRANGQTGTFRDIFLIGPAKMVFEGELEL